MYYIQMSSWHIMLGVIFLILVVILCNLYKIYLFMKKQQCQHFCEYKRTDYQDRFYEYYCKKCNTTIYIDMDQD